MAPPVPTRASEPRSSPAAAVPQRYGGRRQQRPAVRSWHLVLAAAGTVTAAGLAAVALAPLGGRPSGAAAPCWVLQSTGRRGALIAAASAALAAGGADADAFPNAVKVIKRDLNNAKRKGPQPGDLGLGERQREDLPALKECGENTANCFSTTYNELDVGYHAVDPWTFSGKSKEAALADVLDVVNAYPPGQQGIDGGGFQIAAQDENCIYVIFESLLRGHLDDVEFCIAPGMNPEDSAGKLLLRSSSRQGYFDYGVNACRLNRIAADLRQKPGWKTATIDRTSHPRYWAQNCAGGDKTKAPFVTREKFPAECKGF